MSTTQDPNATPGSLKAALFLWMALMAGLLGYSISTADATAEDDHGTVESSENHGDETPAPGESGHGSPSAETHAPEAPAEGPTASPSAH